jgi:hypothetical protein
MTLRSIPSNGGKVDFERIDQDQGTGELRTHLVPPIRPAALRDALRMGFEQLALARIYVDLDPAGTEQLRIHEEAGFRREEAGEPHGLVRLSLREPDWRAACGLGPRVVLMQPQFLPWLGYLELIHRADVFVFLDDFQFSRQSWGQRNRLFVGAGKVGMVTLPIRHEHNLEAAFLELCEADTTAWRRKLRNLLICNYRRAPYGAAVVSLADEWLAGSYANVAELEIALIEEIAAYLGLRPRFMRSSSLGIAGLRRSSHVRAILEKVGAGTYVSAHGSFPYMKEDGVFPLAHLPTYFQNHVPREYPQHGADVFVPRLSCLDALANLPPEQVRIKLRGTEWWQNWAEREAEENDARVHG